MMSQEPNDLITRTGRKDPCGKLMRMYWQPAALADELRARGRSPVKLLGENLVLFRDEQGRYGLIDRHCAHRGADLAFGRLENGGLRCAFHGWLFDVTGQCLETPAEPKDSKLCKASGSAPIPWSRRAASSGPISAKASRRRFRRSTASSRPTATRSRSRATSIATGCRRSRSASIRRMPRSCIVSSRTRIRQRPMASSSAALPPAATCR